MGKSSSLHKIKHRKFGTSNCKRAIKRQLALFRASPDNNPFPSEMAQQLVKLSHDANELVEEIQTHDALLKTLFSTLKRHNYYKPKSRQEQLILDMLGYVPGIDEENKQLKFPNDKIKKQYELGIATIEDLKQKRQKLYQLSQEIK